MKSISEENLSGRTAARAYLDYNATTPLDPYVLEVMLPYLTTDFGNAASAHSWGRSAASAVEEARHRVASLLGCTDQEVVFTSGATESNNLVLKGLKAERRKPLRVVSSTTEHPAVLDPLTWLREKRLAQVALTPVLADGTPDFDAVTAAVVPGVSLVSFMLANNETGVVANVAAIAKVAREAGALVHCDATQALGRLPVHVDNLDVDFLSLSAHKMYGPKGVGALYVRRRHRQRLAPLQHGGGQERGLRNGTLNTPGILGLGAAATLAGKLLEEDAFRMIRLRDLLEALLRSSLPDLSLNGSRSARLPNTLNVRTPGAESEAVLAGLTDVAVSSGSACASSHQAASPVLRAMGLSEDEAAESLRLSVGRFTTEEEVRFAAKRIIDVVSVVKQRSTWRGSQS